MAHGVLILIFLLDTFHLEGISSWTWKLFTFCDTIYFILLVKQNNNNNNNNNTKIYNAHM